MPLNKLDSIIKNTEGRILYVSPSDLDSTDSISNQGNSLARPFKTLQRALIESARFSYVIFFFPHANLVSVHTDRSLSSIINIIGKLKF